jgi:hypothetical protein
MSTYVNILKKVDEKPANESNFKDISVEELRSMCFTSNYNERPKLLSSTELTFLDYNGAIIYDLYFELREYFSGSEYFQKVDYNGFLDIFLNNTMFEELPDDSEDDANNENEDH